MTENAVTTIPQRSTAVTPLQLLQTAMERGTDMDQLTKLMDLQERWEANEAKKAYVAAMNAFKAEPLTIKKGKHVRYTTQKGTTEYDHATLAQVVDAVVAALSKHGLSHRWETNQQDRLISVTCVITHELGHSERTTLTASPDDSGGKNSIQAVGSTVTYLQRYTLMAATGLAAKDMDDDGRGAGQSVEPITAKQLADLDALIDEVGADKAAFLKVCKVENLKDLPAEKYAGAVKKLEAKRSS